MNIPINKTRYSITCLATIGSELKDSYCITFSRSTNKEAFLEHLEEVKKRLKLPAGRNSRKTKEDANKPWLLLDGHSAHNSKYARDYLQENFVKMKIPSYTPMFNSTEWLWALAKRKFRRLLLEDPLEHLSKEDFQSLVERTVREVA